MPAADQVTLNGVKLDTAYVDVLPAAPDFKQCSVIGANAFSGTAGITSSFEVLLKVKCSYLLADN